MKGFQSESQQIKTRKDSTGSRTDQHEDRISELEDEDAFEGHLPRDTLKTTREQEKIYQLFDDMMKTNLRVCGRSEKSQDNNVIKILPTEIRTENIPNKRKEPGIHISEACRTPNSHDQTEPLILKVPKVSHRDTIMKAISERQ